MAEIRVFTKPEPPFPLVETWRTLIISGDQAIEYLGGDYFLLTNETGVNTTLEIFKLDGTTETFNFIKTLTSESTGFPNNIFFKGVTTDGKYIYVIREDNNDYRIKQLTIDGVFIRESGTVFSTTEGITFDGKNLWVLDTGGAVDKLVQYHVGTLTIIKTFFPFPKGQFHHGITFDGKNLWVLETGVAKPFGEFTKFKMLATDGTILSDIQINGFQGRGITTDGKFLYVNVA